MKSRRIYQSLHFKIATGVTIPLLIILAIVSYLRYSGHRDLMMDNLRLSASNLGEIGERGQVGRDIGRGLRRSVASVGGMGKGLRQ